MIKRALALLAIGVAVSGQSFPSGSGFHYSSGTFGTYEANLWPFLSSNWTIKSGAQNRAGWISQIEITDPSATRRHFGEPVSGLCVLAPSATGNHCQSGYDISINDAVSGGVIAGREIDFDNNASITEAAIPVGTSFGTPTKVAIGLQLVPGGLFDSSVALKFAGRGDQDTEAGQGATASSLIGIYMNDSAAVAYNAYIDASDGTGALHGWLLKQYIPAVTPNSSTTFTTTVDVDAQANQSGVAVSSLTNVKIGAPVSGDSAIPSDTVILDTQAATALTATEPNLMHRDDAVSGSVCIPGGDTIARIRGPYSAALTVPATCLVPAGTVLAIGGNSVILAAPIANWISLSRDLTGTLAASTVLTVGQRPYSDGYTVRVVGTLVCGDGITTPDSCASPAYQVVKPNGTVPFKVDVTGHMSAASIAADQHRFLTSACPLTPADNASSDFYIRGGDVASCTLDLSVVTPTDGEVITVECKAAITTLTIVPPAGSALIAGSGTFGCAPRKGVILHYDAPDAELIVATATDSSSIP